ncbi:hypothetical protein METBIDRAFT_139468 [Metschnikowia bicuspidata var. bicuspidata NRRL YB-4993]|uniref:Uncharacterized protein n=1 Tax=Metschnikowia bicuspidata var. bicuspidata NRRL YB-4993 TaxID=869754 RepID=A0A1A0HCR8_9ASCO|nr:hypothetical protein METBIDRAFT_139468 [Metschnikowia bicuspidata var. bicuspidata NRRL YB-4993]OBA21894.1 hypothetical protein METBIDRAFT_139468 [Metschnikowia bicuspidata var. bicuspidata NRRL YB-4993]
MRLHCTKWAYEPGERVLLCKTSSAVCGDSVFSSIRPFHIPQYFVAPRARMICGVWLRAQLFSHQIQVRVATAWWTPDSRTGDLALSADRDMKLHCRLRHTKLWQKLPEGPVGRHSKTQQNLSHPTFTPSHHHATPKPVLELCVISRTGPQSFRAVPCLPGHIHTAQTQLQGACGNMSFLFL